MKVTAFSAERVTEDNKNGKLIKRIVGSKARNVFKTEIDRSLNR